MAALGLRRSPGPTLVATGILALGLAAPTTFFSLLAAPVLSALLLGLDPRSPGVYAAVAIGFLATGVGAAAVPALRAARVDPARALRRE